MPVSEWNGDELHASVLKAAETGLNNAASVLVNSVKDKLGRRGATYKMLAKGRRLLRKFGFTNDDPADIGVAKSNRRAYKAALEESKFGRVDQAGEGGYPRLRTGALRRSTAYEKTGELRRDIGVTTEQGAHIYAPVHEFGSWGPRKNYVPARPVWAPSLRENRDTMFEGFVAGASAEFKSDTSVPEGGAD